MGRLGWSGMVSMSPPFCRPFTACGRSKRSPICNCQASTPKAEVRALVLAEIEDVEGIEPIEGAAAFLASLPPDRWAIVTSSPRKLALRRLEAAGLPPPALLVTSEDVEHGKPAPDCFLLAAKRLGQKIEDCLVFEDAPAGIQAAEAAGAALVVVTTTHNHPLDTKHPTITGYGKLTAALLRS